MSEFKKGQLVACRDLACEEWMLGIFDGERGEGLYVRLPLSLTCSSKRPERFLQVKPAEEVWPNIFLGWERRAGEQTAEALAMESKLVQRLRRQIEWLCRQIMANALYRKQSEFCPPLDMPTGPDGRCQRSCEACWEQASLKAVEDADGD